MKEEERAVWEGGLVGDGGVLLVPEHACKATCRSAPRVGGGAAPDPRRCRTRPDRGAGHP